MICLLRLGECNDCNDLYWARDDLLCFSLAFYFFLSFLLLTLFGGGLGYLFEMINCFECEMKWSTILCLVYLLILQ